MRRIAAALIVMLAVVFWRGGFAGWAAAWHARRATTAVAPSTASPQNGLERALVERTRALDLDPLSRRHRIALESAVDEALPRLGVTRVVSLAPAATLSRSVFAGVLRRYGEEKAANRLLDGIGVTRAEELEVMSNVSIRQAALAAGQEDSCGPSLALFEALLARVGEDAELEESYGGCLTRLGQPERALPFLLDALDRNPESTWVRFFIAQADLALGNLQAAEVLSVNLGWRAPTSYFTWRLRGEVLAAQGRPLDAIYCYRVALRIRPDQKALWYRINQLKAAAQSGVSPKSNSEGTR